MRRLGLADRVRIVEQDLFQVDLHDASVVTVYLGADLNLRLRPKLLAELAPGTRIVSHDFDMGDWRAERILHIRDVDRTRVLYLWTVPPR